MSVGYITKAVFRENFIVLKIYKKNENKHLN